MYTDPPPTDSSGASATGAPPTAATAVPAMSGMGGGPPLTGMGPGMGGPTAGLPPGARLIRLPPGAPLPPGARRVQMQVPRGPPKPDFAALQKKHGVDPNTWHMVYLCYFDARKSYKRGRKIAMKYCVAQPFPQDLFEAATYLGLPCYMEMNKKHPRDYLQPSRMRVLLKKADGSLFREDVPDMYHCLVAMGKVIRGLESRKQRLQQMEMMKAAQMKQMQAAKKAELAKTTPRVSAKPERRAAVSRGKGKGAKGKGGRKGGKGGKGGKRKKKRG